MTGGGVSAKAPRQVPGTIKKCMLLNPARSFFWRREKMERLTIAVVALIVGFVLGAIADRLDNKSRN